MSATAHATPVSVAAVPRRTGKSRAELHERPGVRIIAFAALAGYGVVQWSRLTASPPTGRLLALLALTVALAALAPVLQHRGRLVTGLVAAAVVLAAFPLSGVPLTWVTHVRVAVTADAIGQGLSALPRVLVPYSGLNEWVRMVIVMGAAVLLIDAALMLACSPPSLGDARRAAAALPLIALAVVPSTLLRPKLPYLHGLVLFVLIAVLMWGERIRRGELSWALAAGAALALGGMLLAPALDRHRPLINYQALAGGLAPGKLATFDWSQRYGPLNWPQTGREVLDVQAGHGDYWKAEDLNSFNGHSWVAGGGPVNDPPAGVSAATRGRWTQTIRVTLRAMTTSAVIAAGSAQAPTHLSSSVVPGASPGTWVTGGQLGPGESYLVTTYTPRPSPSELAAVGNTYPDRQLAAYRAIELPGTAVVANPFFVLFPPFHSRQSVQSAVVIAGRFGADLVKSSPYARAYALARRLATHAGTPYAFVSSVQRFLSYGYTYDETPPARPNPLESFLFRDRLGYCQQFAGAMALLLRMGGIPARVSTGFTPGNYNPNTRLWLVSDINAHAWVEAWFPHYGWVRFDPTPGAAPARGGRAPINNVGPGAVTPRSSPPAVLRRDTQTPRTPATGVQPRARSASTLPIVAGAVLLGGAMAVAAGFAVRGRRPPGGQALLIELERALVRSGRPVPGGVTLALLEHRLRGSPEAAGYVRAIRLARFGGGSEPPTLEQRRALRAYLRNGLGLRGAIRALWALPPGWPGARRSPRRVLGPLNF